MGTLRANSLVRTSLLLVDTLRCSWKRLHLAKLKILAIAPDHMHQGLAPMMYASC